MNKPAPIPADAPAPIPLSPTVRRIASAVIALHVAAVFLAPWALANPSRLSEWTRDCFRYYLAAGFLDHGYNFFSPDPGEESHLVRYILRMPDGSKTEDVFPNLEEHRPRLLYHRHFMLTECLNTLYEPAEVPAEIKDIPEAMARYRDRRETYLAFARSYARHLLATTGAESVTLFLRRHRIPSPPEVYREGIKLDDPKLYQDEFIGVFTKDEFPTEGATP